MMLTQLFRVSLCAAMPVTLYALGGPVAIWNEGGVVVRLLLSANILPSAICAPAVVESALKTAYLGISRVGASPHSNHNEAAQGPFEREIRRASGMLRATLFPISGWAVVVQLPVNDYNVYYIPKEGLRHSVKGVIQGAKAVNRVLEAVKFWDGVSVVVDYTLVPTYKYAVKPLCNVVASLAGAAINIINASLGVR